MIELFPRLKPVTAEQMWRALQEENGEGLPMPGPIDHPAIVYTATGGRRVGRERISEIQAGIQEVAGRCGFPNTSSDRQKTAFDAQCARFLTEIAGVPFPEACRSGVWEYFCLVVLPDVVTWRFSLGARERWLGGPRNTLGLLWRRGYLLGADHSGLGSNWSTVERLTQDAFVQILERPGLSANPKVARLIATAWVDTADEIGQRHMETVTRAAARWLGAYRRTYDFDALEPEVLKPWFRQTFRRAAELKNAS